MKILILLAFCCLVETRLKRICEQYLTHRNTYLQTAVRFIVCLNSTLVWTLVKPLHFWSHTSERDLQFHIVIIFILAPQVQPVCVPCTIIRPRHSRSIAAYSDQTFPWKICRSVHRSMRQCVDQSVQCIVEKWRIRSGCVWHLRSDGSRDEAGSGVWRSVQGKGYFWGRIWGTPLQPMGTYFCIDVALFPDYFGQTYYYY